MTTPNIFRGKIEKILWKVYNPDQSPNMEEVVGEVLAELKKEIERLDKE